MNPTANTLYKWVKKVFYYRIQNNEIATAKAKEYSREKWFEFGEKVIRRVIKQPNCTSIRDFECMCIKFKEHIEKEEKKLSLDKMSKNA